MNRAQYAYHGERWRSWSKAEKFIKDAIDEFLSNEPTVKNWAERLSAMTDTTIFDWLDHVQVGGGIQIVLKLQKIGFIAEQAEAKEDMVIMRHHNAQLPRVVVDYRELAQKVQILTIKCDSLRYFTERFPCINSEGTFGGLYARATVTMNCSEGRKFYVVERRGYRGMIPVELTSNQVSEVEQAWVLWHQRRRYCDITIEMKEAFDLVRQMVMLVGVDMAAVLVMEAERIFWQQSNRAARLQKDRQDLFGLGWANHDHHTFRSSRKNFHRLIKLFEMLGFHCRERFYAGAEAGWGAQVLENPVAGLVIFADVDLSPKEVNIDFAHKRLESRKKLGTIGLWCTLHGESINQAGMHHLEIQCSFDNFRKNFPKSGIEVMKPFNDTKSLRQAFTKGERWHVPPFHLEHLLRRRIITKKQYKNFSEHATIGSHLEHLERRGGFKGFRQSGVSKIIKAVDPRRA